MDAIGRVARASQPYIEQIFIRRASGMDEDQLERKLYVIRKRVETEISATGHPRQELLLHPVALRPDHRLQRPSARAADRQFYGELSDPDVMSALCLVHQRFSTNTFPTWHLAHPFRYLCHNGEINTLQRQRQLDVRPPERAREPAVRRRHQEAVPHLQPSGSDSASLDNAVEMLTLAGRELPHVMSMLIPEAWDADSTMPR